MRSSRVRTLIRGGPGFIGSHLCERFLANRFADDPTEGFLRLMSTDDAMLGPLNLGNPNEVSELAQTIITLTGSPSPLVLKPRPIDDPKRQKPDITLAPKIGVGAKSRIARRSQAYNRLFQIDALGRA